MPTDAANALMMADTAEALIDAMRVLIEGAELGAHTKTTLRLAKSICDVAETTLKQYRADELAQEIYATESIIGEDV